MPIGQSREANEVAALNARYEAQRTGNTSNLDRILNNVRQSNTQLRNFAAKAPAGYRPNPLGYSSAAAVAQRQREDMQRAIERQQALDVEQRNKDSRLRNPWGNMADMDFTDRSLKKDVREQTEFRNRTNFMETVLEKLKKDPTTPKNELDEARALVEHERTRYRMQGNDDPAYVRANNLQTMVEYRRQLKDFMAKKTGANKDQQVISPTEGGFMTNEDGSVSPMFDIGTSSSGGSFSGSIGRGAIPDFILSKDERGYMRVINAGDWVRIKMTETRPQPGDSPEIKQQKARNAAALITTLVLMDPTNDYNYKKYAAQRMTFDGKGNPIYGQTNAADETKLKASMEMIIQDQMNGSMVAAEDWIETLAQHGNQIARDPGVGSGGGGGGGGRGGYGRGGGGYGGGYGGGGGGSGGFTTDPDQLRTLADGIARQRLGRALTTEEQQEFVAHFAQLESTFLAAYQSGMTATRLDPESQAVAWIESRKSNEAAGESAGKFLLALAQAMGGGGIFGGGGS